jgi:DNA-binding FadR family transcriptional regulator
VAPVTASTPARTADLITTVTHATFISGMTTAFAVAAVVGFTGTVIALLESVATPPRGPWRSSPTQRETGPAGTRRQARTEGTTMTDHAIIGLQAEFARAACYRRTDNDLRVLRASADRASRLDGVWEIRSAAHAEFHIRLADASRGGAYALIARLITGSVRDLITRAGPEANDLIIAAHRRVIRCLEERDADGATQEMARYMALLSQREPAAVS